MGPGMICTWMMSVNESGVTEEGCLSTVGAGRFAPLCPHSKDQVRFSDTKGQVKICSARTPKTLIMVMREGGFLWVCIKAELVPSTAGCHVLMDWCYMFQMLWSLDNKTIFVCRIVSHNVSSLLCGTRIKLTASVLRLLTIGCVLSSWILPAVQKQQQIHSAVWKMYFYVFNLEYVAFFMMKHQIYVFVTISILTTKCIGVV